MFRDKLRINKLPNNILRITNRPSIQFLLGVIFMLGVVWLGWSEGGFKAIAASVVAVGFGCWFGFIWVSLWVTVELSKERGAIIRRGFFRTWTIPTSAIVWVWAYPRKPRGNTFYYIALRLRVELPDDRRRRIKDLWADVIWYDLGEWLEQIPPIVQELNATLTSCGFGPPADVEQVMQADTDYEWLAKTAQKHRNPHVQAVSLETILKRFSHKVGTTLEALLDSDSPLVALMASHWLFEAKAGSEYFKHYEEKQTSVKKASETLHRLVELPSTPEFVRECARWELQRGERSRRKARSQMVLFGVVGLLLMAVAIFAFFKSHALIPLSKSMPYQILGFFCSFFGTQTFFVGYLYALVLQSRHDNYESLVRSTAASFSYVYAFLSIAVFYTANYLVAFICYLLIYPALFYFTYKRF